MNMKKNPDTTLIARTLATVGIAALLGAGLAVGCAKPTDSGSESASAESTPAGDTGSSGTLGMAEAQPAMTVPSGTILDVTFDRELSSASANVGDTFSATIIDPVVVDGETVIEAGSTVTGKVVEVKSSQKKIGGKAHLALQFLSLQPAGGNEVPLEASFYGEGKSSTKKDAATIGGATAGGALLGRIIGHQSNDDAHGTTVGAIVGAAVGTAIAATNDGEEVTIPTGTAIPIRLDAPVTV